MVILSKIGKLLGRGGAPTVARPVDFNADHPLPIGDGSYVTLADVEIAIAKAISRFNAELPLHLSRHLRDPRIR
jgi:hypothetical protein